MTFLSNFVVSVLVLSCINSICSLHAASKHERMAVDRVRGAVNTQPRKVVLDRLGNAVLIHEPRNVAIDRTEASRKEASAPLTSVNLIAKWKQMFDPAKVGKMRTSPVVVTPTHPDESAPDDEGEDDNEVFLDNNNGGGLWEEEFGSGSDEDVGKSDTAALPTVKPSREPFCGTLGIDVHVDTSKDSTDEDSDDAVFGKAKNDWIEGDDTNLGDDVFGKVNSTWTWGRLPESALDTTPGSSTTVIAFMLTPQEQLQMKEAAVQALRVLTMSPCAGPRRQDPKCKALKDIIRDLSVLGLVFTSARS